MIISNIIIIVLVTGRGSAHKLSRQ